jgi:hypothetical protein
MVNQIWMVAVLMLGALVAILFIISDVVNKDNIIFAIIAYTLAAILLTVKRVVIRPGTV